MAPSKRALLRPFAPFLAPPNVADGCVLSRDEPRVQFPISFSFEGVPASLGQALRNRERGPKAYVGVPVPPLTTELFQELKIQFAIVIAEGNSAATWARNDHVARTTAYRWVLVPRSGACSSPVAAAIVSSSNCAGEFLNRAAKSYQKIPFRPTQRTLFRAASTACISFGDSRMRSERPAPVGSKRFVIWVHSKKTVCVVPNSTSFYELSPAPRNPSTPAPFPGTPDSTAKIAVRADTIGPNPRYRCTLYCFAVA
jgi:hypothetical protein